MIPRVLWGSQVVSSLGLAVVLLTTGLGLTRPQLVHDVGIAAVLSWLPASLVALQHEPTAERLDQYQPLQVFRMRVP